MWTISGGEFHLFTDLMMSFSRKLRDKKAKEIESGVICNALHPALYSWPIAKVHPFSYSMTCKIIKQCISILDTMIIEGSRRFFLLSPRARSTDTEMTSSSLLPHGLQQMLCCLFV